MAIKKQIVLIPFWIQEILGRNRLPLSACLELDKLKNIISMDDIASFSALQQSFQKLIGISMMDELYFNWRNSIPEGYPENIAYAELVNTVSFDTATISGMNMRLFEPEAKTDQYNEPFAIHDITPEVIGIVIYPGFFTNNTDTNLQKLLIEGILKLLYVYDAYHDVAKTPLFRRYLELLSIK